VQSAEKWDFLAIILLKKNSWTKSTDLWTALARSTMDQQPLPRVVAHWSLASVRSGGRELRPRGRGGRGKHGGPNSGLTRLSRQRSGGVMTVKAALQKRSARACSGHGERGRRGGGGAVAVVHHNGDEGGRFRRGSAGE
jgi:hypothetical protein